MKRSGRRRKEPAQNQAFTDWAERSISAGGQISGIASTGDNAVNVQNLAEQMTMLPAEAFVSIAEVSAPPGLVNLPGLPANFVGRGMELAWLDKAPAGPGNVIVQTVYGLGGIGKSALAAHWAAIHADDFSLTWWINAETPTGIDAGLADLAVALQPVVSGLPLEALRERAVQWLAAHNGWLLILDNVTDVADISPLLARTTTGRFLITSRLAAGWHKVARSIRLDVLAQSEAIEFLTSTMTRDQSRILDGSAELCGELGCLPLAIEQAGSYIAETGITPSEYLKLLASYPAEMYGAAAEGGDAARTISRVWRVTLDRLADQPLIGHVLRVLAWYAPENISRDILRGIAEPPMLLKAIGRLAAYSMLTADVDALSVHRLVQAVARTPEPGDPYRSVKDIDDAQHEAARRLAAIIPEWKEPSEWSTWRTLLTHIDALTGHGKPESDTEITASLLDQAGLFLYAQGKDVQAHVYLARALAAREQIQSSMHPAALSTRLNLAAVHLSMQDLRIAIPMLTQTLKDSLLILGEDHPQTLECRYKMANAYQMAGDASKAISLYEKVISDRTRILGKDHPDTLAVRTDLAGIYFSKHDKRAIPLLEENLNDCIQMLGQDHLVTLAARSNLALMHSTKGDLDKAIPLLELAAADQVRVLGKGYPSAVATRMNLAVAYKAKGDLNRAVRLLEQALADGEGILGKDNPQTLHCRHNLADTYMISGDSGRAITLFEQNVAEGVRVLGNENPDVLIFRTSLADARRAAGYAKVGRNAPCPCGSGQKYKNCHGDPRNRWS